jgi:hypothetical protein
LADLSSGEGVFEAEAQHCPLVRRRLCPTGLPTSSWPSRQCSASTAPSLPRGGSAERSDLSLGVM